MCYFYKKDLLKMIFLKIFLQELILLFYREQEILRRNKIASVYPQNFNSLKIVYGLSRVKNVDSQKTRYIFFICKNRKRNLRCLLTNQKKVLTIKNLDGVNLISFSIYTKLRAKLQSNIMVVLRKRCFFNVITLLDKRPLEYGDTPDMHCLHALQIYFVLIFNSRKGLFSIFCHKSRVISNIVGTRDKYSCNQLIKHLINRIKKGVNFYDNCLLNIFVHKSGSDYNQVSLCFFRKIYKHWKIFLKT